MPRLTLEVRGKSAFASGDERTIELGSSYLAGIGISADELLEAIADGAVVVDSLGAIRAVNRRAAAMFGYDPADLVGRSLQDLVPVSACAVHPVDVEGFLAQPTSRAVGELSLIHIWPPPGGRPSRRNGCSRPRRSRGTRTRTRRRPFLTP